MFRKRNVATLCFLTLCVLAIVLDRHLRADSGPATYAVVTVSGSHTPYGPLVQASTQPISFSASVSCTQPVPSDPEAKITNTQYSCSATLAYKPTTQAAWGAPPSGDTVVVQPTTQPSSNSAFTIVATLPDPGYYQISVSGNVTYTDSDGNSYSYNSQQATNAYVTVYTINVTWKGADTLSGTDGSFYATGSAVTNKTCYIAPGVVCQFTGTILPSDLATSSPQWIISDTKTVAFTVSADQSTGSPTYYPGSDLSQYTTDKFFWSDNSAGSKAVQFSVNAHGSSLSASANFSYELPTSVHLNKNIFPFQFLDLALKFVNPNDTIGVSLNPSWTAPAHWASAPGKSEGEQFVQLLADTCQFHHPAGGGNVDYWVELQPESGLDTTYPYGNNPGAPVWSDDPSQGIFGDQPQFPADDDKLSWACSFTTYWAYQPAAADAQFVPLYNIHWHVGGTMSLIAGQNPVQDASWNPVIKPAAAFDDNGNVAGWYQWTHLAGNGEVPVKE